MTRKMTNTIRPSTASPVLPHASDLIHLKPHMDWPCSGAAHPLKWRSLRKTKATDNSHLFLPALLRIPRLGSWDAGVREEWFLICVMLWSCGCGPRSKSCQLLMLSKFLNFPELQFPEEILHNLTGRGGRESRMRGCRLRK